MSRTPPISFEAQVSAARALVTDSSYANRPWWKQAAWVKFGPLTTAWERTQEDKQEAHGAFQDQAAAIQACKREGDVLNQGWKSDTWNQERDDAATTVHRMERHIERFGTNRWHSPRAERLAQHDDRPGWRKFWDTMTGFDSKLWADKMAVQQRAAARGRLDEARQELARIDLKGKVLREQWNAELPERRREYQVEENRLQQQYDSMNEMVRLATQKEALAQARVVAAMGQLAVLPGFSEDVAQLIAARMPRPPAPYKASHKSSSSVRHYAPASTSPAPMVSASSHDPFNLIVLMAVHAQMDAGHSSSYGSSHDQSCPPAPEMRHDHGSHSSPSSWSSESSYSPSSYSPPPSYDSSPSPSYDSSPSSSCSFD